MAYVHIADAKVGWVIFVAIVREVGRKGWIGEVYCTLSLYKIESWWQTLTFVVARRLLVGSEEEAGILLDRPARLLVQKRRRRRSAHECRWRRWRVAEIVEPSRRKLLLRRRRRSLPGHLGQPGHRLRISQLSQRGGPLHDVSVRVVVGGVELQVEQLT